MEGIESLRKAVEEIAANKMGRNRKQPRQFTVQTHAADFIGIIMSLPVESSTWVPLQDPLTGQLYYVSDARPMDSEPIG